MSKADLYSKKEINIIIQSTVDATISSIKAKEKQDIKQKKDAALFNTKLLIKKYRELKAHCDIIPEQIEELAGHDFDTGKMSLDTLMTEKAKTYKMMLYVDAAIRIYDEMCTRSSNDAKERRFKVLYELFISSYPLSVEEISEKFFISKKQVYNDRDKAIRELSTILFGWATLKA